MAWLCRTDPAMFDGMPRSAIDAELADAVAPPEAIVGKILAFLRRAPTVRSSAPSADPEGQGELDKILILLRGRTGHDFSLYKKSTVLRRVERRMGIHQVGETADYTRFLQANPQEPDVPFRTAARSCSRRRTSGGDADAHHRSRLVARDDEPLLMGDAVRALLDVEHVRVLGRSRSVWVRGDQRRCHAERGGS